MKRFQVRRLDKEGKPLPPKNNHYLVVNVDEPYAEQVFLLIQEHEKSKGTWDGPETFRDFVIELTGEKHIWEKLKGKVEH